MNKKFFEDEVTEFKKSTGELKEAIISIVSILNKHKNGRLYFGIKDNGEVVGQEVSAQTLRDISDAISNKIEPRIYPKISNVKIENRDCILVEFDGDDTPYLADGRAYIRVSDQDKKLSINEMRKILLKSAENEKWDERISDKSIDDVNEDILKEYIVRANEAKRISFKYSNKRDILNKLGILKNDRLKNAGKVLFCDNTGVDLQMAIFATDTKTTFIDIDKKTESLFSLIQEAQDYIKRNIIWNVEITDKREEKPEIPVNSIREAIVNSFVHKSYIDPKGPEISIFKNRVEIYNPGPFPLEYTPDDYINNRAHSVLRNPILSGLLYKSSDVETFSSGLQRIYEECKASNVDVHFRTEKYGFTVIFFREGYRREEKVIDAGINAGINDTQKKILILIGENKFISLEEIANILRMNKRTIEKSVENLKEKNLLKRRGSKKSGFWEILS